MAQDGSTASRADGAADGGPTRGVARRGRRRARDVPRLVPGPERPRRPRWLAAAIAGAAVVLAAGCSASESSQSPGTSGAPGTATTTDGAEPLPPRVPEDFRWSGRYVVPDLDAEVPFTWEGRDGNFQMTAGGEGEIIHFTNILHEGTLYTLTYEWPGVPRNPCSNVGPFSLEELNTGLESARFVGAETLEDREPRSVNHFRAGIVWEPPPDLIGPIPGVPQLRIPIMFGDIYVDRDDPTAFWKVLQFGLQNLYDANLDEWIVVDEIDRSPGTVTLPDECAAATAPAAAPTTTTTTS